MNPVLRFFQGLSVRLGISPPVSQSLTPPAGVDRMDSYVSVAPPQVGLLPTLVERHDVTGLERSRLIWGPIDNLAQLAPTPHNTQPFRIMPLSDTEATIFILPERLLPEEDHGNRYMMMSSGIFAEAMEIAGRARGLAMEVTPIVEGDPARLSDGKEPVAVARARIVGTCERDATASFQLEARRTSRLKYHARTVSATILENLERIASEGGQRFLAYDDPEIVDHLLRENARSVIDNLQLANETEEIKGWMRWGETPQKGDGLWETPLGQKKWMTWPALNFPRLYNLPIVREVSMWIFRRTMAGTRHIGLLCGKFDQTSDLFATGRNFLKFWLEMQRHGVVMHPMGSMLTNAKHRAHIFEYFKVTDCWLVFRFGHSNIPPRAPRLAPMLLEEKKK